MKTVELLTPAERQLIETTPEEGFISAFVEWAAMKTDASLYALEAAALQALSLAAGDVVVLPSFFGDKPIYMNLYILLVGPSTTMRKTTVLGYIENLIPTNAITGQSFVRILDDVSIQAFNRELAAAGAVQAPLLLSVDEVAGLFQIVRNKGSYLSGFDKTLMKAYDHSGVHIARVGQNIDANNGAFVNVFAASTPEPLVEVLSADDVESGLLPRFIIFDVRDAARGERVPLGTRLADHDIWEDKKKELQFHLADIAETRAGGVPVEVSAEGRATFATTIIPFDDDAIARLDSLDEGFSASVMQEDTTIGAIKGRAFWHIVKIAGLYALSRSGKSGSVSLVDVIRAMHLVEETIADLVIMRDEVGANLMERWINSTSEMLNTARRKTMKRSTIVRRLKLTAFEVRQLQDTLLVRHLISTEKMESGEVSWVWLG